MLTCQSLSPLLATQPCAGAASQPYIAASGLRSAGRGQYVNDSDTAARAAQACLPFPAGAVTVHTSEWLREVRYYTWQLPEAPDAEQDTAHEAMPQVLISALRSAASAVSIGTPAFAAQAAAVHASAEDMPTCFS